MCWKKKELYVERGKVVIGGIRKPVMIMFEYYEQNAISVSVSNIHEYGLDKTRENVFRVFLFAYY